MNKDVVTHSGSFHADDVFAIAALHLLGEKRGFSLNVRRSRDPAVWATSEFVVDVGGEYDPAKLKFDHHQIGGAGLRPNGIPYAGFGLVWKAIGNELCGSEEAAQAIDRKMAAPLDAIDNGVEVVTPRFEGVYPYDMSTVIGSFVPVWSEPSDYDGAFARAVIFAKQILAREIELALSDVESRRRIEKAYAKAPDKRVIIFDAPFSKYIINEVLTRHPEPLYTLYPHDHRWHVKAVAISPGSFDTRKPFPQAWAGKRDAELTQVSGVPDAVFCHNGRHLAVALSQEGAQVLANKALSS